MGLSCPQALLRGQAGLLSCGNTPVVSTEPSVCFPSALPPFLPPPALSAVYSHPAPRRLLPTDAPMVKTSFTGAWCAAAT